MPRGSEHQALARRQIERLCFAHDFENDGAEGGAGEGVSRGAQNAGGARRTQKQKARRVEAKLDKAGRRDPAEFAGAGILMDPEDRLFAADAKRKSCGKSRCGGFMGGLGENLVQSAQKKAALEETVRIRMAEWEARRLLRRQLGFRQRRP